MATVELSPKRTDARIRASHCHDRWCPACGAGRSARLAAAVAKRIDRAKHRFVTLTVKHVAVPLNDQLDTLYRNFSALRKRKWWKQHVKGGAAFLEVKLSKCGQFWHPHLHLIVESGFIYQRELSREWLAVTGHSCIVDVRAIDDAGKAAIYVAKYATKPMTHDVLIDEQRLDEMILAMGSRRLCLTWGTWRKTPLETDEPVEEGWIKVCSLSTLRDEAYNGNRDALAAISLLIPRYPQFSSFGHPLDSP